MVKPSEALKSLELLKKAGYKIPDPLVEYVSEAERKERKVVQKWGCKKCTYTYESFVKISAVTHECAGIKSKEQRPLTLLWAG